jgi:hypothetical protein
MLAAAAAASAAIFIVGAVPISGQAQSRPITRPAAAKPDLSGIWQAMTSANWDIQAHIAHRSPVVAGGAAFGAPAGPGIVEGNEIPYTPAAAAKQKENAENWLARDPEVKCYMPGVPRMMYMPYPISIVQGSDTILMASEFASASRTIRMNSQEKSPTDTWMGWSVGHWEGNTLVIVVTDQNDQTWFDRAGNHHTEKLKVTERYTLADKNTINYEATMEDPGTFTRPWKISFPLYRHLERNAVMMEYKCVEFVEELMWGHLRKIPTN